ARGSPGRPRRPRSGSPRGRAASVRGWCAGRAPAATAVPAGGSWLPEELEEAPRLVASDLRGPHGALIKGPGPPDRAVRAAGEEEGDRTCLDAAPLRRGDMVGHD